jgi:hypothetical protein
MDIFTFQDLTEDFINNAFQLVCTRDGKPDFPGTGSEWNTIRSTV